MDEEQGKPMRSSPASSMSEHEIELMGQATRCVRKFAPDGRKRMKKTDTMHITACKISDANPNEMIASWSGDHIYSFDLVKSPDAKDSKSKKKTASTGGNSKGKVRETSDLKRKRKKQNSSTSLEAGRKSSKPRRARPSSDNGGDLTLRVRYDNGQSEDIAMSDAMPNMPSGMVEEARESVLNDSQKRSLQIAKSLVRIRKLLFSLEGSACSPEHPSFSNPASHRPIFTGVLGLAAVCLPDMDEISRSWRYPVSPSEEDIVLQQTLRDNRDSSRRFMQAAGTLARVLGGTIQTASLLGSPALNSYQMIRPGPHEGSAQPKSEIFCYDFLKAILLWLEGGPQALVQGFKRPPEQRKQNPRFPLADDAQHSSIDDTLIPYLLNLAGTRGIPNVDASRFERDATRKIFESETAAVISFAHAVKMPLEDLSTAVVPTSGGEGHEERPLIQDRTTASKYWAFKVGRGVLMNAGEGVNFQFVDTAFGGLGFSAIDEGKAQDDVDPDNEEDVVDKVTLVKRTHEGLKRGQAASSGTDGEQDDDTVEGVPASAAPSISAQGTDSDVDIEDAGSDAEVILMDDLHDEIAEHMAAEDEDEENENNAGDDNDDEESDSDDDNDGDITAEERAFMFRSASQRGKLRERVDKDVPCSSHTRQYRGHCNVKTVKDANFFGLQDEYVVSGSDSGHLFIWDKKTSELVNILEGDSEVVNVVQGKELIHFVCLAH